MTAFTPQLKNMKNHKSISTSSMLVLACMSIQSLQGALVVNDAFDYGASDVSDMTGIGGSSWEDGTGNVTYDANTTASWAGDSDYTLAGAGGSLDTRVFAGYRGAQLDLGTALTGTFWTSVLIQETTDSSASAGAVMAFENGDYSLSGFDGFAFGINGDGNLMTAANSGSASSEESPAVALPSGFGLYIAKITVNAGGANDAIDLWAFDSTDTFGQTEASLGATIYSSTSVQYGDSITDVWLGGRYSDLVAGDANFDNLRISDLSGDNGLQEVLTGTAIPEPSSYALILGACATLFVAQRRSRS